MKRSRHLEREPHHFPFFDSSELTDIDRKIGILERMLDETAGSHSEWSVRVKAGSTRTELVLIQRFAHENFITRHRLRQNLENREAELFRVAGIVLNQISKPDIAAISRTRIVPPAAPDPGRTVRCACQTQTRTY